jgi:tRNA A-37 threonylcarbamoyl transferase component Bud32
VERHWFRLCRLLGRLLRAGRYSQVRLVRGDGGLQVRKRRRWYAPLLVWLGEPLVRVLDTGVRVLPQREWEERERRIYRHLYGASIRVEGDGALVLRRLAGETLATLLDDARLDGPQRRSAVTLAVDALVRFHHAGFTHGDAMAENVMVDLDAGAAQWFDFETVHDPARPLAWRRADDVRALLASCLLRTPAVDLAGMLERILDAYADEEVNRVLATLFTSKPRRPLIFHLGQAGLSWRDFREIGRLLRERVGD